MTVYDFLSNFCCLFCIVVGPYIHLMGDSDVECFTRVDHVAPGFEIGQSRVCFVLSLTYVVADLYAKDLVNRLSKNT